MPDKFLRVARVTVAGLRVDGGHLEAGHGLRIGFTITRTTKKDPNTAEVSIYNLNATHRRQLQELNGSAVPVTVEAGYVPEGLHTLFEGDLRHVWSEPIGSGTWITTVSSGDGEHASRTKRTKRTARAGISVESIAKDIAGDLQIGVGNLFQALKRGASIEELGSAFGTGVNIEGNTAKRLNKLMKSAGLEMSIQNRELQILDRGGVVSSGLAAELSPGEGGIIGVPVIDKDGRCSFRSLLRADLHPGGLARIKESSVANGDWRLDSVVSLGDTHGRDWASECEGVPFAA